LTPNSTLDYRQHPGPTAVSCTKYSKDLPDEPQQVNIESYRRHLGSSAPARRSIPSVVQSRMSLTPPWRARRRSTSMRRRRSRSRRMRRSSSALRRPWKLHRRRRQRRRRPRPLSRSRSRSWSRSRSRSWSRGSSVGAANELGRLSPESKRLWCITAARVVRRRTERSMRSVASPLPEAADARAVTQPLLPKTEHADRTDLDDIADAYVFPAASRTDVVDIADPMPLMYVKDWQPSPTERRTHHGAPTTHEGPTNHASPTTTNAATATRAAPTTYETPTTHATPTARAAPTQEAHNAANRMTN
jgi:hypothetical protein